MRRARKMWIQIADQAQLQAIDRNPPGWAAGKKAHAQSEQQVAREERLSPLPSRLPAFYGPLDPFEFCRQPTFRNPLCWLL